MKSITKYVKGHIGIKKGFILKGIELNDLKRNGECIADITSTTCARNTKSATLLSENFSIFSQVLAFES